MIVFPNAKINIGLNIIAKRPDGFHNLETIFLPVGWRDALEYVVGNEVHFSSSGIPISGDPESNLVMKAYRLLQKDFDLPSLKIHLHKQIPFGAGLGGGSSDAAFMLTMLNRQFGLNLSKEELELYAAQLGSDCAFFIRNSPVFASGRGEIMEPVQLVLNDWFILLVKPPVEVSTVRAFQLIVPETPKKSLKSLIQLPVQEWKDKVVNQFESSVFQLYPEIGELKQRLYNLGAAYASMSGSGSCVFGLFQQLPEKWESQFSASFLTFSQKLSIL
ncbi:MAG TPA: 4-(cytidine 5'-diphospho)-2-C-methyl-D-erythritol kinase [Prolixibacteraceae bacterium]|nr:4-(cytidine 5'-diphospho)-2-C-methyl-D-erythritol kinase [Prolixibacteraceae bacterium]